ncbi:hypothetical protein SEUCBS140593_009185 [Sporothrix eucalyptigena]|uniref:Uncharacterized protein n=1 Tax=Sporothrix eucalyptigena TaxID=1812306 RepID=A0ABP0CSQ7_9PEZI
MSQPDRGLETEEHTSGRPKSPRPVLISARYTSGCPELDDRILGGRRSRGLNGGLVGLSAEGDVGIVISLQVAVRHLHQDTTATARLITTLPVAHVVRLLKGVLKRTPQTATKDGPEDAGAETSKLSSSSKASILCRVLVSRIYGHDDLQAVLHELEEDVPLQRLWSTVRRQKEDEMRQTKKTQQTTEGSGPNDPAPSVPSKIIILTEMDHHFKWVRLQNNGGRLYELYGQLMRRLRALSAIRTSSDTSNRPLIFVLSNTLSRRPYDVATGVTAAAAVDGPPGTMDDRHQPVPSLTIDHDTTYRLALAVLQRGRHIGRPDVFRLCCDELAKAQCIEPRYKALLDYYCSLHVCLTRLPAGLVDMWGGNDGGSTSPTDSSLWVATVESNEAEMSQRAADRVGVVYLSRGIVQNASTS